ncbi:MAG: oligoendopeptidase F, partial [Acidobacteriota bacterium]
MTQETSGQDWIDGAEHVRWNLKDLYASVEDLDQDLAAAKKQSDAFARRCKGQLCNWDAAQLAAALGDYERLHDRIGRAYTYAYLHWTTETTAADRGALLQRVREAYNRINQTVLFFELEWIGLEDEKADRLMQDERLSGLLHYLRLQRRMKPHVLSEAEERVLAEKSVTGRAAWNRFFDETMGSSRFPFRGQDLTEQEVLAKLHDSDRKTRREAALALTEGLRRHLRENTFVFNTILADKASEDRLRNYPHWLSSRNLSNQVSDEAANNLIETVWSRFDLVARFYRLKKKLL